MRDLLHGALGALLITAACDGSDPPGGGNGGTTDGGGTMDGTTGNGGTDGYVPNPSNPLIQAMAGTWTVEWYEWMDDGELQHEVPDPPQIGPLVVDPSFPTCHDPVTANSAGGFCYGRARSELGPPGDACVCLVGFVPSESGVPHALILEGDAVRAHHDGLWNQRNDGRVLEDGQHIELHSYRTGVNENFELTTSLRKLD